MPCRVSSKMKIRLALDQFSLPPSPSADFHFATLSAWQYFFPARKAMQETSLPFRAMHTGCGPVLFVVASSSILGRDQRNCYFAENRSRRSSANNTIERGWDPFRGRRRVYDASTTSGPPCLCMDEFWANRRPLSSLSSEKGQAGRKRPIEA